MAGRKKKRQREFNVQHCPPVNTRLLKSIMALNDDRQAKLAEYLGVSLSRVNNCINGKADFLPQEVYKIAARYHLTEEQEKDVFGYAVEVQMTRMNYDAVQLEEVFVPPWEQERSTPLTGNEGGGKYGLHDPKIIAEVERLVRHNPNLNPAK